MTLSRRTFVGLTGAATAGVALPTFGADASGEADDRQTAEPWTAYFGGSRHSPDWGRFRRDGFLYTAAGELKATELAWRLETHAVLVGGVGRGIGIKSKQEDVNRFMNGIRADDGAAYRAMAHQNVQGIMQVAQDAPNPVLGIQLGNEINSWNYSDKIRTWAGTDFPHYDTDYGDDAGANDRDYIGYWVEYFLAPSIAAIHDATAGFPDEFQFKIVCGSLANARNRTAREIWLLALLNYVVAGDFAPALAGRRVADLVDYLSIHYLLTSNPLGKDVDDRWRPVLNSLHDRWVGDGAITGIWHTEEGGGQAERLAQHASVSQRVFARITDWALERNASPEVVRVAAFYGDEAPPGTSYEKGMGVLLGFLGPDTPLVNRSSGVSAAADNEIETYGFENGNGRKRVLFVTPVLKGEGAQVPTKVAAITMAGDGWGVPAETITARAHLFRTKYDGHSDWAVPLERNRQTGEYSITFQSPIDLSSYNGGATLSIHLAIN